MYKTLIQLVLLIILILIIFFVSIKYFNNQDITKKVNNTVSLSKQEEDLSDKNIDNEIINLSYKKFDTNGNTYLIKAKKGLLDSKQPSIIYMKSVEASLTYLNNEKLIIYSKEAIFNKINFKTTFSNYVKLTYQDQILESDSLEFLIDKNIAIFKDNVKYYNHNMTVIADIVNINLLTKEINIK